MALVRPSETQVVGKGIALSTRPCARSSLDAGSDQCASVRLEARYSPSPTASRSAIRVPRCESWRRERVPVTPRKEPGVRPG